MEGGLAPSERDETRIRVEEVFADWVELVRAGQEPDLDGWLAERPPGLRHKLREMVGDYHSLRERMGAGSSALQPGRMLGDFRLVGEIGRGGMAAVWEAEQLSLDRRVALKLLSPQLAISSNALERFEREARAGGRLSHPGIVQIHGVGEVDGIHYIAQELVPGGYTLADSLADLREVREVPPGYYVGVAELFAKAAAALQHAHEQGVIHRDVKPSNILITESDEPRIADFGLARIQNELALSRTGEMEGTPFYMSPEQVAAKRMGIDHRTDVFSLGATLYEALTLRRAFDGDTSQHVFRQILTVDPPDPRTLRSHVSRDLAVICGKALEKDPERRYASMAELEADLRAHLEHRPIAARPPGPVARARKWTRRHPVVTMGIAIASVALIAIGFLMLGLVRERDRANEESRRALESASLARERLRAVEEARAEATLALEASQRYAYAANIATAATALAADRLEDLRRNLDACPPAERGWEWGFLDGRYNELRSPPTSTWAIPDGVRGNVSALALDPRAARLAAAAHKYVCIWDVESGRLLRTLEHRRPVTCLAFDGDAQRLATGSRDKKVRVWDVSSGELLVELEGHDGGISAVGVAPDGSRVASGDRDGDVWLWDVAAGSGSRVGKGEMLVEVIDVSANRFAAAWRAGAIGVWDTADGEWLLQMQLDASLPPRPAVAIDEEAGHLIVADWNGRIQLRSLDDWETVGQSALPGTGVLGIRALDSGDVAFLVPQAVYRWSPTTGRSELVCSPAGFRSPVVSASGTMAYASDGSVELLAPAAGVARTLRAPVHSDDDRLHCLALAPGGDAVAIGTHDASVRLLDANTGETLWGPVALDTESSFGSVATEVASVFERGARSAAFSGDGASLYVGDHDDRISALDSRTGEILRQWDAGGDVAILASTPGDFLVSGSKLRIWDVSGDDAELVLEDEQRFSACALDPDGRTLVLGTYDGRVLTLEVGTWETSELWADHDTNVLSVAVSPDGNRILAGDSGGSLTLAQRDGTRIHRWKAHDSTVRGVAFLPSPQRLVCASSRDTVTLWTGDGERALLNLSDRLSETGQDAIQSLVASPDGSRIIAGNYAGSVRSWQRASAAGSAR